MGACDPEPTVEDFGSGHSAQCQVKRKLTLVDPRCHPADFFERSVIQFSSVSFHPYRITMTAKVPSLSSYFPPSE
jgi:hypothetical protein